MDQKGYILAKTQGCSLAFLSEKFMVQKELNFDQNVRL